jgi:hypothetical protein
LQTGVDTPQRVELSLDSLYALGITGMHTTACESEFLFAEFGHAIGVLLPHSVEAPKVLHGCEYAHDREAE